MHSLGRPTKRPERSRIVSAEPLQGLPGRTVAGSASSPRVGSGTYKASRRAGSPSPTAGASWQAATIRKALPRLSAERSRAGEWWHRVGTFPGRTDRRQHTYRPVLEALERFCPGIPPDTYIYRGPYPYVYIWCSRQDAAQTRRSSRLRNAPNGGELLAGFHDSEVPRQRGASRPWPDFLPEPACRPDKATGALPRLTRS